VSSIKAYHGYVVPPKESPRRNNTSPAIKIKQPIKISLQDLSPGRSSLFVDILIDRMIPEKSHHKRSKIQCKWKPVDRPPTAILNPGKSS
jgi:hypothetical protein